MAFFRGMQSIRIFRRSRPQSEEDRHEIQTLKTTSCESATLPCASATAPKSASNLSSQNSALRKSTTGTSLRPSGGKVPQSVNSESRDEKQRDGSFMKKSEEGKKRSDQNPFGQVRPSRSEVIGQGGQGPDSPPLPDKQPATNSMATVKPGPSSRQSGCTSLQHPQRAEDVCRGTTAERSRTEKPVDTPDQFGGAAAGKSLPGGNQHSGDVEDHRKGDTLSQEMFQKGSDNGLGQKHTARRDPYKKNENGRHRTRSQSVSGARYARRNNEQCHDGRSEGNESTKRNASEQEKHARRTSPREKETRQYQEMPQSEKAPCARRSSVQNHEERGEMNEDVNRNTPEQEIPQKTDKTGARPKHCNTSPSQPVAAECIEENLPKQTTVYIRIHDVITDITVLGSVLTARVSTAGVELMPTETGVKHCSKYTYCSLVCDSKNAARKLIGLLVKKRRQFRPVIDCHFTPYTPQKEEEQCNDQSQNAKQQQEQFDDQHQDAKQQEQVKNKRQYAKRQEDQSHAKEMLKKQVLFEINSMSEQALLKHKQAKDDVEKKADKSKSKLGNRDSHKETLTEIAALESKLEELEKEKAEFNMAFEGFKAKLMTLLETDTYEEDVKALRKQLGIECSRLERALPMYARRQDVLHLIQHNRVSVLLAETGSGKSTQIVQYLLEAGFAERGMIVCTQPRKVAVITLSTRVAEELATNVGQRVGYKAGVRVKTSPSTKILYMTDHALLNECLTDPDLKSFSCIVVDEAHERSLYTDLLLTMIKRCLNRRSDLRVIITSATIDPQVFVNFFGTCPIMKVSGRAFPVDVVWEDAANEENDFENYVDSAVSKVVEIHRKEPPGDILVFLTSAAEIQKCCDMTQQRLKDRNDFSCLPLHGQLQSEEQQKVFKPLERNMRKIVYATNCAETSITIDGIKYVVDTGVAKEMVYDAKKKVNSLVVTTISQSSAEQRKGRAGRTAPGRCYRLYSRRSYQSMDKISLPDILKIHLSLALLKLAELGFTPDMYDFVQSPSQDSIDAALKTLHQLEALDDNVITDTGKWIVKLPFDPKLGRMTLNGHRCGLLYDTIVLASLMSTGSGLFYRGSTDKDRNKLDKVKLKFSHEGGDGLTSLEVYKAWQSVEERQKSKWCMGNSVNAKAIRGIRDSVKEIVQILRKEAWIEVSPKFSDAQDAADKLRKIIFQCNAPNLCHYLGKERAGYFAAEASRQVHFHPSSTLCSLASYPQWVVYDQLLKTSRDFITGVTPVDDAWLQEMNTQLYGFDVNQVSQKKLNVVVTQPAGSHAFFAMVGPRYSHLRHYEEEFSAKNAEDVVIVEARKEAGELKVFSTGSAKTVEELKARLTSIVDEAVREVQQEVQELTIGSEDSGLRVLLGQGGQLTDILMPEDTRKVFITHACDDLTVEMVREKFEDFGDICYIHQFPSGKNWGFVVYRTPAEAAQAAEVTRDDDSCVGELERRWVAKHQAGFKAKLFWCRRPCKGLAFVDISPAFMSLFLQLRDVYISNNQVTIKINRKRPDDSLCLMGLPADISEDLIKRSLLNALRYRETKDGIIEKVTIVREHVGVTDKNKLKRLEEDLKEKFTTKLNMSSVRVNVWPPKEVHTVRFAAEACFTDPIEGFDACKRLQGRLRLERAMVDIEPIVSATLHIQRLVYKACKEDLDKLKREKLDDVEMEIEQRGSENWLLHLKADDMQTLVQARTFVSDVVKGDVLDCNAAPALRLLMTPAGRKMIKEAEGQTEAYVCVDKRTQTLAIHGSAKACTEMRLKINDYLDEVLSGTVEELTLRGNGRPPGLLKTLITKFDEDLETLRHEAGLFGITINYRLHKLKLTGPPESLAKAKN